MSAPPSPLPVLIPDGHRGERGLPPPKSNHHPYAIKTTSTALLTRSNSTGNPHHTRHFYVPQSPSPRPSSRHRYSRSDTAPSPNIVSPSPRPLPVPPAFESPARHGKGSSDGRNSRDDIQLSLWTGPYSGVVPTPPPHSPIKVDDLPSNPKLWTTSQLASYLITSLRIRSGGHAPLPLAVARDIIQFVREAKWTGRAFLRLTETDLEIMGVNNLWREALLNASRDLRQNVLKGQIWGFGVEGDDAKALPFQSSLYNSSTSSVDLASPSHSAAAAEQIPSGHVKGMIQTLERRASMSSDGGSDRISLRKAYAYGSGSEGEDVFDSPVSEHFPLSPLPRTQLIDPPLSTPLIEEEPSMEELLSKDNTPKNWGAKAWEEADFEPGVTVKRLPPVEVDPFPTFKTTGSGRLPGALEPTRDDNKRNLDDIFSRPLPEIPPESPEPQLIAVPALQPTPAARAYADKSTQTEKLHDDPKKDNDVEIPQDTEVIAELRRRLADVEQKLENLSKDPPSSPRAASSLSFPAGRILDSATSNTVVSVSKDIHRPADIASQYSAVQSCSDHTRQRDVDWDPLENGLPSYLMMVGVGVCAVVLQTMLKRWVGKRP